MIDWHDLYYLHHRKTCAWATAQARRLHPNLAHYEAEQRAEDAVQTAWVALLARGLGPGDTMPGLLMSIAVRALYEAARKQGLRDRYDRSDVLGRTAPLGGKLVPKLVKPAELLTEQRLEAWVLKHVEGMSYTEIEREMEIPSATGIISQARKILKGEA